MEAFYSPNTIRNITIAILDMFNNIKIKKYDSSGTFVKTIDVPLTFSPQEKYQKIRTLNKTETNTNYYLQLPRLALGWDGVDYDSARATGVNETRMFYDTLLGLDDGFWEDYMPTPYNFNFTLYIRTESLEEFSQIVENILPYFNPSLTLRVKEFSFLNIERDLQVMLGSITPEFLEDQTEADASTGRRYVNANVKFVVKGYMYRPLSSDPNYDGRGTPTKKLSGLIRIIKSQYYVGDIDLGVTALESFYQTSGVTNLSAAPDASTWTTSGTLPLSGGYFFTSGSNIL